MKHFRFLLLLPFLGSCSFLGATGDRVETRMGEDALVIMNHTREDIYGWAATTELASRVDLNPRVDGPPLARAMETRRLPFTDISVARPDDRVIVYWWNAVRRDGKQVPGRLRSVNLQLPYPIGTDPD